MWGRARKNSSKERQSVGDVGLDLVQMLSQEAESLRSRNAELSTQLANQLNSSQLAAPFLAAQLSASQLSPAQLSSQLSFQFSAAAAAADITEGAASSDLRPPVDSGASALGEAVHGARAPSMVSQQMSSEGGADDGASGGGAAARRPPRQLSTIGSLHDLGAAMRTASTADATPGPPVSAVRPVGSSGIATATGSGGVGGGDVAYLEHHGIEDVIQDALLSVLTVQPTAPLTHISVLLHAAALHRGEDATRSSHIQPPWGACMASSRLGNFEPSRWSWGVGGGTGCTGVSGDEADRTRLDWLAHDAESLEQLRLLLHSQTMSAEQLEQRLHPSGLSIGDEVRRDPSRDGHTHPRSTPPHSTPHRSPRRVALILALAPHPPRALEHDAL